MEALTIMFECGCCRLNPGSLDPLYMHNLSLHNPTEDPQLGGEDFTWLKCTPRTFPSILPLVST
jgi:hypothetical protein